MNLPLESIDPDGLLEYSVVFTDESLNHMSAKFIDVMQETLQILRDTYGASTAALVPGGGTYAMEAVARQLATGKRALVLRNGLFSYRWSQILESDSISSQTTVCAASPESADRQSTWHPAPVQDVVDAITANRPEIVFAPHVETSAGILLPDDYLRQVASAAHQVGALFVLDCIASGALWVDMAEIGVDVLLSAPQKGWSGFPGVGLVMLNDAARDAVQNSTSTSFAMDLKKWLSIAESYRDGSSPYHATLPTDTITHNLELMKRTLKPGLQTRKQAQIDLGARVRELMANHGFASVAAAEFAAPSVVVLHTDNPDIHTGAAFKQAGVQVAAGVPLQCGEGDDFSTFRMGLFGVDKLDDLDGAVNRLQQALSTLNL